MKNISMILNAVAVWLMMLIFHAAQSQTFQNTFNAPLNDGYVAGAGANADYFAIGNTSGFPIGSTARHILFSKYNSAGVSQLDRVIFDASDSSHIYNARDMQVGYSKYTGSPSTSDPEPPCNFNLCPVAAPSAVDIADPNNRNYLYITGFYQEDSTAVKRLVAMRTDRLANFLWVKTNLTPSNPEVEEEGVSVESCPNRDVIIVSMTTELSTGLKYPTISRLDSAGNTKWRYHYKPDTGDTTYNFIPRQSCIFRENTANGDPIGIVVVGEIESLTTPGTNVAVMRVKYNGEMIWKYDYALSPTAPIYQSGLDIMTEGNPYGPDPARAEYFVLTGMANPSPDGPGLGTNGIVMRVATASGAFANGYFYSAGGTASLIYGQGIFQAISPKTDVVITGGVENDSAGVLFNTYLLKTNPATGVISWARNYPLTTPNFLQTETVGPVQKGVPTNGYFISTNNFSGGALLDGHIIRTDILGNVNAADCLSDTFDVSVTSMTGQPMQRCTGQECDTLIVKILNRQTIVAPHGYCFSAVRLQDADEPAELTMSVFPNPATDNVSLVIVTETSGNAVIQLIALNGQMVLEEKIYLIEGKNEFQLDMHQLPAGVYSTRLISHDVVAVMKLVKSE